MVSRGKDISGDTGVGERRFMNQKTNLFTKYTLSRTDSNECNVSKNREDREKTDNRTGLYKDKKEK